MPSKYQHLAAACGLALLVNAGVAEACAGAGHWSDLGPPAFSGYREALDAGSDTVVCAAPAARGGVDIDLADVSIYAGMRFLTWDAAPAPISLRLAATDAAAGPDLPAPAADTRATETHDAIDDGAPDRAALAMFLAGFLGTGLVALRRGRA